MNGAGGLTVAPFFFAARIPSSRDRGEAREACLGWAAPRIRQASPAFDPCDSIPGWIYALFRLGIPPLIQSGTSDSI